MGKDRDDVQELINDTKVFIENVNETLARVGSEFRFRSAPVLASDLNGDKS